MERRGQSAVGGAGEEKVELLGGRASGSRSRRGWGIQSNEGEVVNRLGIVRRHAAPRQDVCSGMDAAVVPSTRDCQHRIGRQLFACDYEERGKKKERSDEVCGKGLVRGGALGASLAPLVQTLLSSWSSCV